MPLSIIELSRGNANSKLPIAAGDDPTTSFTNTRNANGHELALPSRDASSTLAWFVDFAFPVHPDSRRRAIPGT
jgi:hypothetical protein